MLQIFADIIIRYFLPLVEQIESTIQATQIQLIGENIEENGTVKSIGYFLLSFSLICCLDFNFDWTSFCFKQKSIVECRSCERIGL